MKDKEKKGMKCHAIVFHSDFAGELKKVSLKEGIIKIDDENEVFVGNVNPFIIKTGFGSPKQFYLLGYDSIYPAGFETVEETIEYKKTGNEDVDSKNYVSFLSKLKGVGFKKKIIPSNKFTVKVLKPLRPEFYKDNNSPKLIANTADLRFLKNMKKYIQPKGGFGGSILITVGAFIFGILWMLLILYISGSLKV